MCVRLLLHYCHSGEIWGVKTTTLLFKWTLLLFWRERCLLKLLRDNTVLCHWWNKLWSTRVYRTHSLLQGQSPCVQICRVFAKHNDAGLSFLFSSSSSLWDASKCRLTFALCLFVLVKQNSTSVSCEADVSWQDDWFPVAFRHVVIWIVYDSVI